MTTNLSSRQKWTLWITLLVFLLAFAIFGLAPKISAETFDTLNLGNIDGQAGWFSWCGPGYGTSTSGQVVNTYASSSPNSLKIVNDGCAESSEGVSISLSATTTATSTAEFDVYMKPTSHQLYGNSGSIYFEFVNTYLTLSCVAIPAQDGYSNCGIQMNGMGWPPSYDVPLDFDAWTHVKWSYNTDGAVHKIESWSSVGYRTYTHTGGTFSMPTKFSFDQASGGDSFYFDNLVLNGDLTPPPPPTSSLTITAPTSGSTASTTFPLNFTYNLAGEDYNKLLVVFEAWTIIGSTTCPVYGTPEWQEEYDNGWFYNQSLPYFSPRLTATSTSATSSISVYNLDQPYFYNCVHCYFYNADTATSTFEEKCPDYNLVVSGYVSPGQPLPIGSWPSYYASHTDAKFPTSTAIFTTITGVFSDIVQKITSFVNDFRTIFDSESAFAKGAELGSAVPTARGYLKPINDFFGSLPVSEIFIFCILTLLVVNVYRLVKTILQLIRG
jgi:hypothetical protein